MTDPYLNLLPTLEEFELPDVPWKVVDPSSLPKATLSAFDSFMSGASVPHRVFVYSRHSAANLGINYLIESTE
ncbi:hypothetical protein [Vibrio furnissii]|uniref:hypothetical protein n=1 Tax=Vibrio furnissii TaxID=29494 RepID=UPI001E47C867|nr:hypothetical protein [Vibrio furnissii]UHJ60301.1 hypothetical protein LUM42_00195 [Vibrio furnissii]